MSTPSGVRFYHFRLKNKAGDGPAAKGGVTLAVQGYMSAASVCSLKDNYNKKRGRQIAGGRLAVLSTEWCRGIDDPCFSGALTIACKWAGVIYGSAPWTCFYLKPVKGTE